LNQHTDENKVSLVSNAAIPSDESQKLRIAIVGGPYLPIPPVLYGGTEVVLAGLVEELVAMGHDVTVYTPADSKVKATRSISFLDVSLRSNELPDEEKTPWIASADAALYYDQVYTHIATQDYDIVHGHLSARADLPTLSQIARLQVAHVMTVHSPFPFERLPIPGGGMWINEKVDKKYMRLYGSQVPLVGISQAFTRHQIAHLTPEKPRFLEPVYNGVNLANYVPDGQPDDSNPFFFWWGRFSRDKGALIAILTAKELGIPLVLGGTIDDSVQDERDYFHKEVYPLIDGKFIKYIGPVSLAQKIHYLSRSRAFLNPIQWDEPFGIVAVEAMALGCPVIITDRGAAAEVVADGLSGIVVPPNHDKIIEVAGLVEACRNVGALDRNAVRQDAQRFSVQAMAQEYLKLYWQLISQSQGI
jgi:glycosyltransferase involved in cell wall biosynthesis